MKLPSYVYSAATAILLITVVGCGKKSDLDPQIVAGQGSAPIKLTQNGQVITEFKTTRVNGIGDDACTIVIASPDDKHALDIGIVGKSTGTYPFIGDTQTLTNSKAFLYQSYSPAGSLCRYGWDSGSDYRRGSGENGYQNPVRWYAYQRGEKTRKAAKHIPSRVHSMHPCLTNYRV